LHVNNHTIVDNIDLFGILYDEDKAILKKNIYDKKINPSELSFELFADFIETLISTSSIFEC
jgi:hypothetical protein